MTFNKTETWFMTHWRVHKMLDRTNHPPVPDYNKQQYNAIQRLAGKGIITITQVDEQKRLHYVINKAAFYATQGGPYLVTFEGMRLCQDNAWRTFAPYGDRKGCVKEYADLAAARRKAKRVGGTVVRVPDGMEIDAAGQVIEYVDKKPVIHQLQEYVI